MHPGSMYDRHLDDPRPIPRPRSWFRYRIELLTGITGARMAKYRVTWKESILSCVNVIWRPQILGILIFEVIFTIMTFSTSIDMKF